MAAAAGAPQGPVEEWNADECPLVLKSANTDANEKNGKEMPFRQQLMLVQEKLPRVLCSSMLVA